MKSPQKNKKTISNQNADLKKWIVVGALLTIGLVVFLVTVLPASGVGLLVGGCSIKNAQLKRQDAVISSRIEKLAAKDPSITGHATTSGDCLTGSGTTFYLTSNKQYPSYKDGQKALFALLEELRLPTPESTDFYQNSFDVLSNDGRHMAQIRINNVEYALVLNKHDNYNFDYSLTQSIPCNKDGAVPPQIICDNGVPLDKVGTPFYMASKPIKSASVTGRIDLNLYHIYW